MHNTHHFRGLPAASILRMVLIALAAISLASPAAASERASITLLYGGTVSKVGGDRDWRPSLWLDGTYRLVGPLQMGAYVRWLGEDFGLKKPGFGGGAMISLRPSVSKLRLLAALSIGGLRVPVAPNVKDRSWTVGLHGGLGYALTKFIAFENRFRYERYFDMPANVSDHAWTIEGGLTVSIP